MYGDSIVPLNEVEIRLKIISVTKELLGNPKRRITLVSKQVWKKHYIQYFPWLLRAAYEKTRFSLIAKILYSFYEDELWAGYLWVVGIH